jgi:hypothetical protein
MADRAGPQIAIIGRPAWLPRPDSARPSAPVGRASELKLLGYLPVPTGYVFTREDGSPIHPDYISQHFDLIRNAGIPPCGCTTCATVRRR